MDKNPGGTLERVNKALAALSNPRHFALLENWRDHWWGETVGDLQAVMDTLAPDPHYRAYGSTVFGKIAVDTTAGVRQIYGGVIDAGICPAGILEGERFAYGDFGLMCEAIQHVTMPGFFLSDPKYKPERRYLISQRYVTIHPFNWELGLSAGEIGYMDDPFRIEDVTNEHNPNYLPGQVSFEERLRVGADAGPISGSRGKRYTSPESADA